LNTYWPSFRSVEKEESRIRAAALKESNYPILADIRICQGRYLLILADAATNGENFW
jgi:hypothetical protein